MEKKYDVVIIGGGINGLVCGCYLAKAGAKTLIVESRHETGGGLVTEDFAGFRHNLHATYHLMADVMPPAADLDLARYGALPIFPEVQVAMPFAHGEPVLLYRDIERTMSAMSSFAPEDTGSFRKMYHEFNELCAEILIPATYAPPIPPLEYMVMLNGSELGRRLAHLSELSPLEILDEYQIKNPRLRAALLFLFVLWGAPPDEGGLGYLMPLYLCRMTNAALMRGGSHRLSSALARIFVTSGGDILDGEDATAINVNGGSAVSISTAESGDFEAAAVVSTLNPEQTFMKLLAREHQPEALFRQAANWKWEKRSLFGVHLSLAKKPKLKAAAKNPDVDAALLQVIGYESEEEILSHLKIIIEGGIPPPAGHATVTTSFDTSQAPDGCHTGRWECFAPYGADWDKEKESFAKKCVDKWSEHAEEPLEAIRTYIYSPRDIEAKLSTMKNGSIKHGDYNQLQMGYFRPNDLCSGARTPVGGLYVCGASVYPGGMILAGGGYIAAGIIADDLKLKRWWKEPANITRAREMNFIQ